MIVYIKNRPCTYCKVEVEDVFNKPGLTPAKVKYNENDGIVYVTHTSNKIDREDSKKEVLDFSGKNQRKLSDQIKSVIVYYVYNLKDKPNVNFSTMLSKELNYTYAYLANFFSEFEAITIEQYMINLKIERVKELIMEDQFNLSEIAYKLHYSSVAHLSNQFKKLTGLTPSLFKSLRQKRIAAIRAEKKLLDNIENN